MLFDNPEPKHTSFPAYGSSVVTCLIFSNNRIISASDDTSIFVHSPETGELLHSLLGHDGGVWSLAAHEDTLVSGSTDRTVRVWDLATGRCTHVFSGHTATVRCLAIVHPEAVDVERDGLSIKETWPQRPLIVTGSRDHSLRVWTLPRRGEEEFYSSKGHEKEDSFDPGDSDIAINPYHKLCLTGHEHAVRALAAQGRIAVSGSFDSDVRVWDIITGECKHTLRGHSQKVYSVVIDFERKHTFSGSMDGTIRMWDIETGECLRTLTGHVSLVGLLGLSTSYLVSGSADSTLRVWDSETGELQHVLAGHTGAITTFQHDEFKVLSGSDGVLRMWSTRDGTFMRDIVAGITGVWQVVFEGRWCIAAANQKDVTLLHVWDFGKKSDGGNYTGDSGGGDVKAL